MRRRSFLTMTALPMGLAIAWPGAAFAKYEALSYRRGLLRQLQGDGRRIVVNFTAEWSPMSRLKRDMLAHIKAEDARYAEQITFVDIDWDTFGPSRLVERMRVRQHATLVGFRGSREVARVSETFDEGTLRNFLDQVLSAG